MNNHDCTVVNDGKDGLELIKTNQFDAIVLDLAMPDFDGHAILDTLQKEDLSQIHKIVILTASGISVDTIEKFKKMGVSACLQKPVDIDQLLSNITSVTN
jgi:CheY-like chemotaxis protein